MTTQNQREETNGNNNQPANNTAQREETVEEIPVVADGAQRAPTEIDAGDVERLTGGQGQPAGDDQAEQGEDLRLEKRRRWYDETKNQWYENDDDGVPHEIEAPVNA